MKINAIAAALLLSCGMAYAAPKVEITTNLGAIVVELNPEKAPKTVENFITYVKEDFYSGTIFHRVIDGFMVQGGGFNVDYQQKETHPPIVLEAQNGLSNEKGTIAMARTSNPDSATAQFFINVVDNVFLNYPNNGGYAVFGKVVEGMDVVDKIRLTPTGSGGPFPQDVPKTQIIIEKINLLEDDAAPVDAAATEVKTTPVAAPAADDKAPAEGAAK